MNTPECDKKNTKKERKKGQKKGERKIEIRKERRKDGMNENFYYLLIKIIEITPII